MKMVVLQENIFYIEAMWIFSSEEKFPCLSTLIFDNRRRSMCFFIEPFGYIDVPIDDHFLPMQF